jgi:hypothetical protein
MEKRPVKLTINSELLSFDLILMRFSNPKVQTSAQKKKKRRRSRS